MLWSIEANALNAEPASSIPHKNITTYSYQYKSRQKLLASLSDFKLNMQSKIQRTHLKAGLERRL